MRLSCYFVNLLFEDYRVLDKKLLLTTNIARSLEEYIVENVNYQKQPWYRELRNNTRGGQRLFGFVSIKYCFSILRTDLFVRSLSVNINGRLTNKSKRRFVNICSAARSESYKKRLICHCRADSNRQILFSKFG